MHEHFSVTQSDNTNHPLSPSATNIPPPFSLNVDEQFNSVEFIIVRFIDNNDVVGVGEKKDGSVVDPMMVEKLHVVNARILTDSLSFVVCGWGCGCGVIAIKGVDETVIFVAFTVVRKHSQSDDGRETRQNEGENEMEEIVVDEIFNFPLETMIRLNETGDVVVDNSNEHCSIESE